MIRDLAREDTLETRALLLASIYKMSTITGTGRDDIALLFSSVGLSAFKNGENDIAEEFFRIAVEISDDLTSKNNLAYIIRKKGKLTKDGKKDVIGFLTEGVRNKEPYSLINMAMLFSIELGGENDWIIADELMSLVGNGSSAESWWQELGEKDDPEGYLVLLWLLRHHTITDSAVGSDTFCQGCLRTFFAVIQNQTLDFVAHGFFARFTEMDFDAVGGLSDFLYHYRWRGFLYGQRGSGCGGAAVAGVVVHRLSFP